MISQNKNVEKIITHKSETNLEIIFEEALSFLKEIGEEHKSYYEKILKLKERLITERIHLAVLGQFKRGKSSLINALLGSPVLPTSVIPLTSIPTYIRYSKVPEIKITFNDNRIENFTSFEVEKLRIYLEKFVSEELNPKNFLNVEQVDFFFNSPLLEKGVVLIDTPGIGSTHQHNTEATLNFLPNCDASIFLISPDPPITEVELNFLNEVRQRVKKIFFILNKVDYLNETELKSMLTFLSNVINEKANLKIDKIFSVSARNALGAIKTNDKKLYKKSGFEEFVNSLFNFITNEKKAVLNSALTHKIGEILNSLYLKIKLTINALNLPLEELAEKLNLFNQKIDEAKRQKIYSFDLIAGEYKRLLSFLEEQAEYLRKEARSHLESIVNEFLTGDNIDEKFIREKLALEIPVFFEHHLGELSKLFDSKVRIILTDYEERINQLIDIVKKNAVNIFNIQFDFESTHLGLDFVSEPYWVMHQWKYSLSPIPPEWIDKILPTRWRKKRIKKRLEESIERLVISNVENLRWATIQNLDKTFLRFNSSLDEKFDAVIELTNETIKKTFEKRKNYSVNIEKEIKRYNDYLTKIEKLNDKVKFLNV